MRQPNPDPHHVSSLLQPALNGIVAALADRGEQSGPEYEARRTGAWTLIQSFQPRDAIDLLLVGQLVAINELFADGTRDVLRGTTDSLKQRTRSSLLAMARLTQGHLDRLEKRRSQAEIAEPRAAQCAAAPPSAAPETLATPYAPREPEIAAASPASPAAKSTPKASGTQSPPEPAQPIAPPAPPPQEPSWLDEPYQEWLLETPAMLVAQKGAARKAAVPKDPAPAKAAKPANGVAPSWSDEDSALPHQHPGPSPSPRWPSPEIERQPARPCA